MTDREKSSTIASRWRRELRNHPVIRVAGAYCLVAWIMMQAGEIILPSFEAPTWIMQTLIAVLVAGLPVVLILARLTRLSSVIGLTEAIPSPVAFGQTSDPLDEAGDILRLKSASLEVPMDLSEARQVSTLVCSLVGLRDGDEDPEILLGFLDGMKQRVAQLVVRYEGTRLPSSRNEIVVAFGHPTAHEDDARRAAKLALDLLELIRVHDVADGPGTQISSRVGLHTATIIIDESAPEEGVLAMLGDAIGVATYLQASAAEGEVLLSAASQHLLRGYFLLEDAGCQSHPRLGQNVQVFRLAREFSSELVNVVAEGHEVIGREHERSLLLQQWGAVLEGESEYVLIKGEPGMGKSSLLYNTVKDLVASGEAQLMLLSCEPYYRDTPFRPLINFLERRVFEGKNLSAEVRRERLREFLADVLDDDDDEAIPLLAALLSGNTDEEQLLPLDSSSKRVREKTLALLVSLIERFAARQPLVLAVEDLHWADPSTRDLIESLLATDPSTPILGLFTARPEFEPSWVNLPDVIEINLNKLSSRVAAELIHKQAGQRSLPEPLVQQIVDNAGGIPLYIEQLTQSLLESRELGEASSDAPLVIPPSLKASLAARIDHLGSSKPLLQLCSVVGYEFSYELLRAVCDKSSEALLRKVLNSIVNAGLIYQKGAYPEATFKFKHRLIMEVASQSLLRRTRQRLHQVIADKLEGSFPEHCNTRPTQAAHHFSRAGNASKAISYWIKAAQLSQLKFANEEAVAQVQRGLAALKDVPDLQLRTQYEVQLQGQMGMIRLASQGYTNPDVRVAFERALELSDQVKQTPELFKMMVGLWMYYLIRGEYDRALELSGQLLRIAETIGQAPELLQANYCAGYSHYYRGEIDRTLRYFDIAQTFESEEFDFSRQTPSRDDTRIHLHCLRALALWSSGDPRAAGAANEKAIALARKLGQPYGLVWALFFTAWLEHMRGNHQAAAAHAAEFVGICEAKGFAFFIPLGLFFKAGAIENPAQRLEALTASHEITMATGARAGSGYLRAVIVKALLDGGEARRAAQLAKENEVYMEAQHEWVYHSENLRLRAILVRDNEDNPGECVRLLERGIAQAKAVNNLPFALACAVSLYEQPGAHQNGLEQLEQILARYSSPDVTAGYLRAVEIVTAAATPGLSVEGVSG